MTSFSKKIFIISFLTVLFSSGPVFARTKIWQQPNNPANYVGLENLKEAEAEDIVPNHPYTFDPKKLADMFLSVRYNKALLFRKDIVDQQVFFDLDTLEKKFIPHIVEAFEQVGPNQVVSISMVQKDPFFIVRNDRLNIVRAFVAQDGLHLRFIKTNAKLIGDYQSHTQFGAQRVDESKGLKTVLEPQEGQVLSFTTPNEIILDMNYDFATQLDKKAAEEEEREKEEKKRNKRSTQKSKFPESTPAVAPKPAPAPATTKTTIERLKELKQLKDQGLISPQEYEAKKKEILKDI